MDPKKIEKAAKDIRGGIPNNVKDGKLVQVNAKVLAAIIDKAFPNAREQTPAQPAK